MKTILKLLCLFMMQGCLHVLQPSPPSRGELIHYVERGESLAKIADSYGLNWRIIATRNQLSNPDTIKIGQEIIIPKGYQNRRQQNGGLLYGGNEFYWPVDGKISSHFGPRGGRQHRGIDIRAVRGTLVFAAKEGKVEYAGWMRGYGKTVIVNHGQYSTLYAHLSKIKTKRGSWITRGRVLGAVGATGNATGNHLHFEIRKGERAVNPMRYYANR